MNELFKAIYSYFTASPHNVFYNSVGGRLYVGAAPQECALPYAVYFGLGSAVEDTFEEEIDDISIQFNIFSDKYSYTECGELSTKCKDLFDGVTLEVDGSKDVLLSREILVSPIKIDEDSWMASIEFQCYKQII